ncbi:hypothetical protein BJ742DRAFT_877643 [Cladochytrium replicatum]|nr:hypothetical protein BJ742DRAFT_877643 [Cladochytrium replicatum]
MSSISTHKQEIMGQSGEDTKDATKGTAPNRASEAEGPRSAIIISPPSVTSIAALPQQPQREVFAPDRGPTSMYRVRRSLSSDSPLFARRKGHQSENGNDIARRSPEFSRKTIQRDDRAKKTLSGATSVAKDFLSAIGSAMSKSPSGSHDSVAPGSPAGSTSSLRASRYRSAFAGHAIVQGSMHSSGSSSSVIGPGSKRASKMEIADTSGDRTQKTSSAEQLPPPRQRPQSAGRKRRPKSMIESLKISTGFAKPWTSTTSAPIENPWRASATLNCPNCSFTGPCDLHKELAGPGDDIINEKASGWIKKELTKAMDSSELFHTCAPSIDRQVESPANISLEHVHGKANDDIEQCEPVAPLTMFLDPNLLGDDGGSTVEGSNPRSSVCSSARPSIAQRSSIAKQIDSRSMSNPDDPTGSVNRVPSAITRWISSATSCPFCHIEGISGLLEENQEHPAKITSLILCAAHNDVTAWVAPDDLLKLDHQGTISRSSSPRRELNGSKTVKKGWNILRHKVLKGPSKSDKYIENGESQYQMPSISTGNTEEPSNQNANARAFLSNLLDRPKVGSDAQEPFETARQQLIISQILKMLNNPVPQR